MIRFFCYAFILVPTLLFGQVSQPASKDSLTFEQYINKIEKRTTYNFYYRNEWIKEVKKVHMSTTDSIHWPVLQHILSERFLYLSIDERTKKVYISPFHAIQLELPPDFFGQSHGSGKPQQIFDYSIYETVGRQQRPSEMKMILIGDRKADQSGYATISGYIKDTMNGEPLPGTSIFVKSLSTGVLTDQYGYYALTIPKGRHDIDIRSIGMKSTKRMVMLFSDGKLDIELHQEITPLKEITIESNRDTKISDVQMGVERLDIKTLKQLPLTLGEADIIKGVLTLPGVQTVGEGTVGLNVRGGATNQNLIYFNGAVVYNPSHLFGFFSTFNPDLLKNVELYKSGIKAEYGGRLSSVLDVRSKDGNSKKISGSAGISPITGRFMIEGPLIKDRTTFTIGGRTTYSNWMLRQLDAKYLKRSKASFYDVAATLAHRINDKNNINASIYFSEDEFKLQFDTAYQYKDQNASVKWQHIFNGKLYGIISGSISRYSFGVNSNKNPTEAFDMDFRIRQQDVKGELSYLPNSMHSINAGFAAAYYDIAPGELNPRDDASAVVRQSVPAEQAVEAALYIDDNFDVTENLSLYAGMRYSFYQFRGRKDVYTYELGVPRTPDSINDTILYQSKAAMPSYSGIEPRISMRYAYSSNSSVKISYNRMRQYIQMLSNTTAITPTDIWKLSDRYIEPQIGDQFSIGFYHNLKHGIEASIEGYYKTMTNMIDYRGGAVLLLNKHIETEVVKAEGKAYGIEFMIRRSTGKLNGWVTYTYSRSFLKTVGLPSEQINNGTYYPSNHDKPHSANFISNYKFSRRLNLSLNFVYSTGRPITLPVALFDVDGVRRLYYSNRNQHRIPDYYRCDISVNIEGNHKVKKLAHSSWSVSVYNLLSRANAYSIFFTSENNAIRAYKLSIFARPIPTVTYNLKF